MYKKRDAAEREGGGGGKGVRFYERVYHFSQIITQVVSLNSFLAE